MYIPNLFKNTDIQEVKEFLTEFSFGILISTVDNRYWGTHIPLELDRDDKGRDVLYGHISRANSQWKDLKKEDEVLAIFHGPHSYVSSSWYGHENVPTWNYMAVHIYGHIEELDENELWSSVSKLVDKYEKSSEHPVSMDSMSEKTLRQLKGIFGFKITITEIQAAFKLSQNRDDTDYQNVIDHLNKSNHANAHQIAGEMSKRRRQ